MQTDAETKEACQRLYGWLADCLGEQALLLITPMMDPGPQQSGLRPWYEGMLLSARTGGEATGVNYWERLQMAHALAKEAGLVYAHQKRSDELFHCHNCGELLLGLYSPRMYCEPCTMAEHFCHFWRHEQHITEGRCDHCCVDVPLKVLPPHELNQALMTARHHSRQAVSERATMFDVAVPRP
jgi:hypothetical protein